MSNFKIGKTKIVWRILRGLHWEKKPFKVKCSADGHFPILILL